jgi:hypothetical protein
VNLHQVMGRVDIQRNNALVDGSDASQRRGGRFQRPKNQDYRLAPEVLANVRQHGATLLSERGKPQADYRPVSELRCVNDPLIGEKLVVHVSAASKWDGGQFSLPRPLTDKLRDAGAFRLASLLDRVNR